MANRFASWTRRHVRVVYLAPALALIALLAWSLASPIGASPDDDYHLDSIWCGNGLDTDACPVGETEGSRLVPDSLVGSACYAGFAEESAACQDVLSFDIAARTETDRGNFLGQYPPLYYTVMHLLAGPGILESAWLMRVLTVLIFVGITTALCSLLPAARRTALIGAWVVTTVPLGAFLLASNNPSSWALIGVGSSWLALVGYFESNGRRRVALGALYVVAVLMAAGSRSDAAIYTVLASAVAVLITFRRDRSHLIAGALPVVMAVVAAVFYLTSGQQAVVDTGLGSGGSGPAVPDGSHAPRDAFGLLAYNILYVPTLWVGAFGQWGLGWLDTSVPPAVWVGAAGVFAVVTFAGMAHVTWRKAAAGIGVALALWAIPVYVLVRGNNIVGENVQPRYLLPLLLLLAGVALLPIAGRPLQVGRLQLVVVGLALVIANTFALHSNIRRYVTGVDRAGVNLDAGTEWWWTAAPSPMAIWIIGSLAYAGLLAVLGREVVKRDRLNDRIG